MDFSICGHLNLFVGSYLMVVMSCDRGFVVAAMARMISKG